MALTRVPYSELWVDETGQHWLEYKYPLRGGAELCTLILPRNLNLTEVGRLKAFLETLVDVTATAGFAP